MRTLPLLLALLAACPESAPTSTPAPGAAQPAIEARVADVANEYLSNPAAAELKYGGRRLRFRGAMAGMEKDDAGVFWVGIFDSPAAMCGMRPGQTEELAKLVYMQSQITLEGTVAKMDRVLKLKDCELLSHSQVGK